MWKIKHLYLHSTDIYWSTVINRYLLNNYWTFLDEHSSEQNHSHNSQMLTDHKDILLTGKYLIQFYVSVCVHTHMHTYTVTICMEILRELPRLSLIFRIGIW